jgi:hypothetical protein
LTRAPRLENGLGGELPFGSAVYGLCSSAQPQAPSSNNRISALGFRLDIAAAAQPVSVPPVERKLATIFALEIAGNSRLTARNDVGMLARLKASRMVVDRLIGAIAGVSSTPPAVASPPICQCC